MEIFINNSDSLYSVTDDGDVYSHRFNKKKLMKPSLNSSGYLQVSLILSGVRKFKLMHRLVAEAFLEGYEEGLTVNHIDHNKLNNNLSNLNIMSHADNTTYAAECMRMGKKLNREDVLLIKKLLSTQKQSHIARRFGVSEATISYIKSDKFWKHV